MENRSPGRSTAPTTMTRDLYALLGVSPAASAGELKRAFRTKARATHPDSEGRGSERDRTARMAELNAAYTLLADPVRRAAYDAERSAASAAPTAAPAATRSPRPTTPFPAPLRRPSSLRPRLIDLVALPGSFLGYTLLPELSPGTSALAGAAWGALLAVAAGRLAAQNGHLDALADRFRHR